MSELYPEAKMIPAMKIWKLPQGKENMFSDICASGEYFGEEKIDGSWYMFERTQHYCYLFSRSTSTVTGELSDKLDRVPHIKEALEALPAETIIIGEIYYPGGESRDTTTIMGALPQEAVKRQVNNPIHYYLHDIIYYDGVNLVNASAENRYKILRAVWKRHNLSSYPFLRLAESFDTDIETHLARILAEGGEGIVLRKKNLPYYPGSRPAWSTIKMKKMDNTDLVCMGFCDPTVEYTGKEIGTWPYWIYPDENGVVMKTALGRPNKEGEIAVTMPYYKGWKTAMKVGAYDDNGTLVELGTVSSGLTDIDRYKMAVEPEEYLNHVFGFSCMELNKKDHTLRHPVLVGPRPDKPASDCRISEIFS